MATDTTRRENDSVLGYSLDNGSRALVRHDGQQLVATVGTPDDVLEEALILVTFDRHPAQAALPIGAVERELDRDGELLGTDQEGGTHVYQPAENTVEIWEDSKIARAGADRTVDLDEYEDKDVRSWTHHVADKRGWA